MSNLKTLALAGVTVLSLGGVAMAQEGSGPSMPTADYWAAKTIVTHQAAGSNQIQSGSSDVNRQPGDAQAHFDHGVLNSPG